MDKAKMTASKTNERVSEWKSANKNATKDKCDESKWKKRQRVCVCTIFYCFSNFQAKAIVVKVLCFVPSSSSSPPPFPVLRLLLLDSFFVVDFLFHSFSTILWNHCTDTLLFSRKHIMVNSTRHSLTRTHAEKSSNGTNTKHWLANHHHGRMNETLCNNLLLVFTRYANVQLEYVSASEERKKREIESFFSDRLFPEFVSREHVSQPTSKHKLLAMVWW